MKCHLILWLPSREISLIFAFELLSLKGKTGQVEGGDILAVYMNHMPICT
jgi:hypothetical protein